MASVLLTNTSAVAAIGTSPAANKAIKLDKNKLVANGPLLSVAIRKLVVKGTITGAVTSGTAWLYWDVECDDLAVGPIALTASNTLTAANTANLSAFFDIFLGPPSTNRVVADVGCIYLVLVVNANQISVAGSDVELTTRDDLTAQG